MSEAGRVIPFEKRCPACDTIKQIGEFYRAGSRHDGVSSYCKGCDTKLRCQRSQTLERREIFAAKQLAAASQKKDPHGFKTCPKCNITKALESDFYVRKASHNGRACYCKECELHARRKAYKHLKGRESHKSAIYKSKYGISLAEARDLLSQQLGGCANRGCGKAISFDIVSKGSRSFANCAVIDHCHETGKIRGVLCHKCNTTAGIIESNKCAYLGILDYLARHSK